ncbi:hypothetical protein BC828DRAFT_401840 [Blastocladiella britannica]|nr:hypothetical protein BC828DRAFT_401840 [Blastocladiella britannica]
MPHPAAGTGPPPPPLSPLAISATPTMPADPAAAVPVAPPKSPLPGDKALNFAQLAMRRNYSGDFPSGSTPASGTGAAATTPGSGQSPLRAAPGGGGGPGSNSGSASSLPSAASMSPPASMHSIESAPDTPGIPLAVVTLPRMGQGFGAGPASPGGSAVPASPFSPPSALNPAAATTLREFMRDDRFPRRQRKYFVHLQKMEESYSSLGKLAPAKPKKEKKSSDSGSSGGTMGKLSSLLTKKKGKQKTVQGLFHLLRISIMEERQDVAIDLLEQLPSGTIKKKRQDEVNYLFLMALSKRMERVCLKIYEKGYPAEVNAPIFSPNVPKGETPKFGFPSFFLLSVGFGMHALATSMVKKAHLQQTWYGLSPLLLATAVCDPTRKIHLTLVQQIIAAGGSPSVGIPLDQYLTHKKLRPRPSRAVRAASAAMSSTSYSVPATLTSDSASVYSTAGGSSYSGITAPGGGPPTPLFVTGLSKLPSFSDGAFGGALSSPSMCAVPQLGQSAQSGLDAPEKCTAWAKGKWIFPFDLAAAAENVDLLQVLLRKTDAKKVKESSTCYLAQNNFNVTVMLWKAGANPEQRDWGGLTGLHMAARLGMIDMVFLYLEMAVDVNMPGENGWTALHEAISQRQRDVARLLMRRGALTSVRTSNGATPVEIGRRVGLSEDELVEYLSGTPEPDEATRDVLLTDHVASMAAAVAAGPAAMTASSEALARIGSGLLSSGVGSATAHNNSAGTLASSTDKSMRKRAESMPTAGHPLPHAGHHPPSSPLAASAASPASAGVADGVHAKKKKRSTTLDKFAMLRQTVFSSSGSELPPMAGIGDGAPSSSAAAAPPVPPKDKTKISSRFRSASSKE